MEAAGDVGAGDDLKHRRVVTHPPGAEALADVGVEVEGHAVRRVLVRRVLVLVWLVLVWLVPVRLVALRSVGCHGG